MILHRPDDGTACTVYNKAGRRLGQAYHVLYLWINAWLVYQSGEVILRHDDWKKSSNTTERHDDDQARSHRGTA